MHSKFIADGTLHTRGLKIITLVGKRSIKVWNMSATTDNSKRFVYWNSFPSLVLEIALPEGNPDIKFTQSYKIWENVRDCSRDLQTNKQDDGKITAVPVLSGMKFTGFRQTPPPWAIHLFSDVNDSLEATRSVIDYVQMETFSALYSFLISLCNVHLCDYAHNEDHLKQIAT